MFFSCKSCNVSSEYCLNWPTGTPAYASESWTKFEWCFSKARKTWWRVKRDAKIFNRIKYYQVLWIPKSYTKVLKLHNSLACLLGLQSWLWRAWSFRTPRGKHLETLILDRESLDPDLSWRQAAHGSSVATQQKKDKQFKWPQLQRAAWRAQRQKETHLECEKYGKITWRMRCRYVVQLWLAGWSALSAKDFKPDATFYNPILILMRYLWPAAY